MLKPKGLLESPGQGTLSPQVPLAVKIELVFVAHVTSSKLSIQAGTKVFAKVSLISTKQQEPRSGVGGGVQQHLILIISSR
tara:strand:- start:173 stop:415 length:243 start_codon:yes stop_codon:yes gene_type:complete